MIARTSEGRAKGLILMLVLQLAAACGSDNGDGTEPPTNPPNVSVTTVQVNPGMVPLTPSGTQQLTATARNASGADMVTTFTWSSSASFVASVSVSGLVTGVSSGSATIRVSAPNGVYAEAAVTVTAPPSPQIVVAMAQQISAVGREPSVSVQVPADQKVIGCGARTHYDPVTPGLLLTAVYPSDARTCTASAKDHVQVANGSVQVWAIALVDPGDEWDVVINSQTQPGITAMASLPGGYTLTGGGGRVSYLGAGVLLTSSRPNGATWVVGAKEHLQSDATAMTTSYVIGVRPRNGAAAPTALVNTLQLTGTEARATVEPGYTLVGGGANIAWKGMGRLLTGSYPDGTTWIAAGKEHLQPDTGPVTAYVIGLRVR